MNVARKFRGIVAVALFLTVVSTATAKYSGGTGEPNDPYQIATAADLIALGETPEDYDKHFLLTADIDLDPNLPGRKVFDKAAIAPDTDPVKDYYQGTPFTGVFDGNGHTLSHLTVRGKDHVGLFGELGSSLAEVRDLGIVDVNIAGSGDFVGGLVGENHGTLTQCYSTGAINGTACIGGVVGENFGYITYCHSSSRVGGDHWIGGLVGTNCLDVFACYTIGRTSGGWSVGGLIGWNISSAYVAACRSGSIVKGDRSYIGGLVGENHGYLTHCYSTGPIESPGEYVGGLVGENGGFLVAHCYSTSRVVGSGRRTGGLVGGAVIRGNTVSQCFWDIQSSGKATSEGGTGLTSAEMLDPRTYPDAGWDFVDEVTNGTSQIWQMPDGGGYPILAVLNGHVPPEPRGSGTREEDPYLIGDAWDLGAIYYYNHSFLTYCRLVASIDLEGIRWGTAVVPRLVGTFDGNGHTISHLTITGGGYLGLFGQSTDADIKNIGVVDVHISGSGDYVAGLVGNSSRTGLTDCYSSGVVNGAGYAGGLAGHTSASVTRCFSAGIVNGTNRVGGLVGANDYWRPEAVIANCHSSSAVTGVQYVGGLVGENCHDASYCFSTGSVRGTKDVGGLVGSNRGVVPWILCCYSTADVSGVSSVGGLVGSTDGSWVVDCYSTGLVVGDKSFGGLLGYSWACALPSCEPTTRCFWDMQTSGQAKSAGGKGKTTTEMQTARTFLDAGWDLVGETANGSKDIWKIAEGSGYPRLSWEKYSGGTGEPNDPYQIATAGDVIALGETPGDYDKHFLLTADIDLDPNLPGRKVFDRAVIGPDVNDLQYNFQGTPFTGTFDGGGHAIRNLTIADPNHDCLGLFGMIAASGRVGNLALLDANISGGHRSINVGTLAGCNAGTLADCSATGIAIGCGNVRELAGSNSGAITDCRAEVRVDWLCE